MPDSPGDILFISHNAADRAYAKAIHDAILELLDQNPLIDVRYSTSDKTGPQGGAEWRQWIYARVVDARSVLVLVTPHALGKPWLLWEAGACCGAALAQKAGAGTPPSAPGASTDGLGTIGTRLQVSIAYGLTENECPDPLRGDQILSGTNVQQISGLLYRILRVHRVPEQYLFNAGTKIEKALAKYLGTVQAELLRAPSLVNESNVQDWLARLDELVKNKRLSELESFQRWMMLAFGRDGESAGIPIDVRLHRRFGELYLGRRQWAAAVEQLTLARRAAPRDIYVLRPLAEASMKRLLEDSVVSKTPAAREEIESLLDAMKELDPQAFVATPDAAALRGKYLRRVIGDVEQAIATFEAALRANPDSYYLADLLAQTQLEAGQLAKAKGSFQQALAIVERLRENNIWSHATAATACVAIDDPAGVRRHLSAIVAFGTLSPAEEKTIESGLRDVATRFGMAQLAIDELLRVMTDVAAPASQGDSTP